MIVLTRRVALTMSAAAAVLAAGLGPGRAEVGGREGDTASLAALALLIEARLAVMPDVARHKFNTGAAVEDLPREAAVISAAAAAAEAAGVGRDLATRFFRAQIEAAKILQAARIESWKAENRPKFQGVPDLGAVIRPKLDALGVELIAALKAALPALEASGGSGGGARLASWVHAGTAPGDQAALARAISW